MQMMNPSSTADTLAGLASESGGFEGLNPLAVGLGALFFLLLLLWITTRFNRDR